MDGELSSVYFDSLNTEVYGFSYHSAEITAPFGEGLSIPDSKRIRILMLHGGDAKHVPFDKNVLAALPFSYIALGHIHKPAVLMENRMAYCGSPEPLDLTETGAHGYFLGEIDEGSGRVVSLSFQPVSQAQYIPLVVNVTPATTNEELAQIIAGEIRKPDFEKTLFSEDQALFHISYHFLQGKRLEGILIGGNIRCLLKLAGTEYWPDMKGKVLLLEALGGDVPKMAAYLSQLNQLHVFEQINGILLGTFTEMEKNGSTPSMEELVVNYTAGSLPIAKTQEIGHGKDAKAVLIGEKIRLC